MPLVSIGQELRRAQQGHYAVPLFDVFDMQSAEGVFKAIKEKHAPVIVAMHSRTMGEPNARALAAYIRQRAAEADTPVSLMLDHGNGYEQCIQAISYGFSDVMFDGSKLSYEENMAATKAVARAAHAAGLCAEAELGRVGHGSEYQTFGAQGKGFTDPASVEKFVGETGVDFLAIAIGNAHGLYVGEPNLDISLLRQIRARVDAPLVLHGGTGISEAQFRAAIAAGVTKINVSTDLYVTTTQRLFEAIKNGKKGYFIDLLPLAIESFRERCCYYLDLFGASGKAL
jgi:fructose-bisphosphate aldolase class II